ncbi:hypothetical protein GN956_G20024 [Arapaima gigas]
MRAGGGRWLSRSPSERRSRFAATCRPLVTAAPGPLFSAAPLLSAKYLPTDSPQEGHPRGWPHPQSGPLPTLDKLSLVLSWMVAIGPSAQSMPGLFQKPFGGVTRNGVSFASAPLGLNARREIRVCVPHRFGFPLPPSMHVGGRRVNIRVPAQVFVSVQKVSPAEARRQVLPAAASVGAFSPGGGPLACLPGWVRKALLPQVALLAWPQFTPAAKRRLITSYSATGLQRRPARRSSGPVEETCKDEERQQTSETQGESGKGPESRKGDMWQSVEASGGSEEQVKDTRRQ